MSTEQAPSIGTVSLNFDPTGVRVRRIVEKPVDDPSELDNILDQAYAYAQATGATRTVVRALVPADLIDSLNGIVAEASIPLSDDFGGLYFSYFGDNAPERTSTVIEEEMDMLRTILERPVKKPREILAEAEARGFRFERLQGVVTPEDYARLVAMYRSSFKTYPFSIEDQITAMIENPDTQVYVARHVEDGQLYAVAATEQVELNTGGERLFVMREMGDSAKMPDEKAKGLNAGLKLMLLAEAAYDGVDMLFCESRAALGAVNAVNHGIGMNWCGLLPKHCVISGPSDVEEVANDGVVNGRYGNMNVWACDQEQIRQIGSQVHEYYAAR